MKDPKIPNLVHSDHDLFDADSMSFWEHKSNAQPLSGLTIINGPDFSKPSEFDKTNDREGF